MKNYNAKTLGKRTLLTGCKVYRPCTRTEDMMTWLVQTVDNQNIFLTDTYKNVKRQLKYEIKESQKRLTISRNKLRQQKQYIIDMMNN